MADLQFSRADIEGLAQKLGTLQPQLSDQERALLLAIFAAAADRAERLGPGLMAKLRAAQVSQTPASGTEAQVTLTDLRGQLLNAYAPGNDFDSVTSPPIPKVVGPPPPGTEPPTSP